jgi:hypothetical protein
MEDAIKLAMFLKREKLHPEQVQDFYPTPGTVSTCMYYTGLDPYSLNSIYVAKTKEEKAKQRALLQYFRPENKKIILSALKEAGREDLIGFGNDFLVAPDRNTARIQAASCDHSQRKNNKKKTSLTKHLKKQKKKRG